VGKRGSGRRVPSRRSRALLLPQRPKNRGWRREDEEEGAAATARAVLLLRREKERRRNDTAATDGGLDFRLGSMHGSSCLVAS